MLDRRPGWTGRKNCYMDTSFAAFCGIDVSKASITRSGWTPSVPDCSTRHCRTTRHACGPCSRI